MVIKPDEDSDDDTVPYLNEGRYRRSGGDYLGIALQVFIILGIMVAVIGVVIPLALFAMCMLG